MSELLEQYREIQTRIERLESAHTLLAAEAKEVRVVLGGDLSGKAGILQNQVRTITTLFDEKEGLVPRLTILERQALEQHGMVKGVYWAWMVFGGVIGALLMKYVVK